MIRLELSPAVPPGAHPPRGPALRVSPLTERDR